MSLNGIDAGGCSYGRGTWRRLATAGHPAAMLRDGTLELTDLRSLEHPDDIASLLVQAGVPPTQVLVEEEDLEQYFLRLVGMNGGQNHA